MIKMLWMLLMMSMTFGGDQNSLEKIRNLYQLAAENHDAAKELLQITEDAGEDQDVFLGYKGAAHMMMAKHVINPLTKMNYFNKGKKIFTQAISNAPGNVELRFLRFAVQSEAPVFLGYRGNLEEDKEVLLAGVGEVQDRQAQEMIVLYLLGSDALSVDEKRKIKKISQ